MRKELTRAEAVALVGADAVEDAEKGHCDFTNRLTDDGTVEFATLVDCVDQNGEELTLVVYYYQDEEDVYNTEDLSDLHWEVAGYEIRDY